MAAVWLDQGKQGGALGRAHRVLATVGNLDFYPILMSSHWSIFK